jgi:hypothetical protein
MAGARDQIITECAIAFEAHADDCNKYLKAVAALFFEPDLFAGPGMNADAIVAELRQSGDWTQLGTSHVAAIRDAQSGEFVIGGMSSDELSSAHGHVAVIVGDEGQLSGKVVVPICYAGSLSPSARVERRRVSETFGAKPARECRISYFSRQPQTIPAQEPVGRLVDFVRGVRGRPELVAIDTSKKKRTRKTSKPRSGSRR